jgi:hypothetical protein
MVAKKSETIPASVSKALGTIAKGLGVAAGELWGIFVRQYLVRGIAEAFTSIVLIVASLILWQFISWFVLIPIVGALVFAYGAILYLGNPKYYAILDITRRIKSVKEETNKVAIYSGHSGTRGY